MHDLLLHISPLTVVEVGRNLLANVKLVLHLSPRQFVVLTEKLLLQYLSQVQLNALVVSLVAFMPLPLLLPLSD
jgi:hypothetical protein